MAESAPKRQKREPSISVLLMDESTLTVAMEEDMAVNNLVSIIEGKTGKHDFEVFYDGVLLESGKSIKKYQIDNHDNVCVIDKSYILADMEMWGKLKGMVNQAIRFCSYKRPIKKDKLDSFRGCISYFLDEVDKNGADVDLVSKRFTVFRLLSIAKWLCRMYTSADQTVSLLAREAIKEIRNASVTKRFPPPAHVQTTTLLLQLALFLDDIRDATYYNLRRTICNELPVILQLPPEHTVRGFVTVSRLLPLVSVFLRELVNTFRASPGSDFNFGDITHFDHIVNALENLIPFDPELQQLPIPIPIDANRSPLMKQLKYMHPLFGSVFDKMQFFLERADPSSSLESREYQDKLINHPSRYLKLLKSLHVISKLFDGRFKEMVCMLQKRAHPLNKLVYSLKGTVAKDAEQDKWLIDHKDLLDSECRSLLALRLFPPLLHGGHGENAQLLINRSRLLDSSVLAVNKAEPKTLRRGLNIQFMNEQGIGDGVLRDWMSSVWKEISLDAHLFSTDDSDQSIIYINPELKVVDKDDTVLKRAAFFGRMLALAAMQDMRVGVFFPKIFFKKLTEGRDIRLDLEDIKEVNPESYKNMKTTLEMDLDGSVMDIVTDTIKELYLKPLVLQVVDLMSQGFRDIIGSQERMSLFFKFITCEDLNNMIGGSKTDLSVDEWKKHTDWQGFSDGDVLVAWFWEIVTDMSNEQQRQFLTFWTGTRYLPVGGFTRLARLQVVKDVSASAEGYPTANTCFNLLKLPAYQTFEWMKERMQVALINGVGFTFE